MDSGLDMLMTACDGLVNGRLVLKIQLGDVFEDSRQVVDARGGGEGRLDLVLLSGSIFFL